jgi:hypothetical protein
MESYMEHDNKNIRRQYGILFIFPYISWLLFFPSINFGLYEAEIFPWALLISVVFIERYNKILLIAVLYLSLSAVMATLIYESYFESIRSLAAYLNALLAFSLIFSLPTPYIIKLTKQVRKVLVVLVVLGLLQYLQIINFIDPVLKFLVPRADSSSLDYMNRGVTLLTSEPARAGVEFVFIYMVLRVSISSSNFKRKLILDVFVAIFLLFVIKSAMAVFMYGIFLIFTYRLKLLYLVLLSVVFLTFLEFNNANGRVIDLIYALLNSESLESGLYLLMNTSGHRLISIYAFYMYGLIYYPFGGGVGGWISNSIEALSLTGVNLEELRYFQVHGDGMVVPIRSSGYISNLILDVGVVGVALVLFYLKKGIGKFSTLPIDVKNVVLTFFIKILFVGSVGTPVAFVCVAICVRNSFVSYKRGFK